MRDPDESPWKADDTGRIWAGDELVCQSDDVFRAHRIAAMHNAMLVMLIRGWMPMKRPESLGGGWMVLDTGARLPHQLFLWRPWATGGTGDIQDPFEALLVADRWAKERGM